MKFSVYNAATGQILRWGELPDENVPAQVGVGEALIEGEYDGQLFYWSGAVIAFPPRPRGHDWDWGTKSWVPNLPAAKAEKWEQIKKARSATEYGGFTFAGNSYDSDAVSVQRINGAVSMALIAQGSGQSFAIDWTLADNSVVTLQLADVIGLGLTLGQFVSATHERARALRIAIEAATTVAEVEAVSWT